MTRYKEIDIRQVKTTSIRKRKNKVTAEHLARPMSSGNLFRTFWKGLPPVLASRDLKELVDQIVSAIRKKKPVLIMMGAHVIKVGLSPIITDLMKMGAIQGIALNGAGVIHDLELSYFSKTSEDVASSLKNGQFGMVQETALILNQTIRECQDEELGFGEAIGKRIAHDIPPHFRLSILGKAYQLKIPVTVHVALGTDIIHQHPSADGAAIGEMSLRDFRIWTHLVSQIGNGGVVLLIGSSVVLPEVFLKALTVARNITGEIKDFTTASFDIIRHYRPQVNVVERPTQEGGKGYTFVGHHEIMIPLLAAGIKESLVKKSPGREEISKKPHSPENSLSEK